MPKTLNYQELQEELQDIMTRLEEGELDIDEAVKCYERGLRILKLLEERLAKAENTISELRGSDV
jgi:exodeoxyribonuclease VII small subunit